jgi:NAD(P)-dependent dehydrogenase (short-subunit alcohol dehydrogenase family)
VNEPGTQLAGVALVTGAAGGIGRAIVAELEADGRRVVGSTRSAGPWAADMADRAAAGSLVNRVLARFGRLDLLVANHATMDMAPIDVHPLDDWWRIVDVNLSAVFRLVRSAAPALKEAEGSVVLISSEWGLTGAAGASAYAASKAGLIGLTKGLARELAPSVRVNAIAPGVIDTPQLRVDAAYAGVELEAMKRRYAMAAPLGRIGRSEEIAQWVSFLAGSGGAFMTGQVVSPNGGTTLFP